MLHPFTFDIPSVNPFDVSQHVASVSQMVLGISKPFRSSRTFSKVRNVWLVRIGERQDPVGIPEWGSLGVCSCKGWGKIRLGP